jgi:hypothetical protein
METYIALISVGLMLCGATGARLLRETLITTLIWRLIKTGALDQEQQFEICSSLASALASNSQPASRESSGRTKMRALCRADIGHLLLRRRLRRPDGAW